LSSGAISAKRLECHGDEADGAPPDGELDIGERVLRESDIGELVIGSGEPDIGEEWSVGEPLYPRAGGGLRWGGRPAASSRPKRPDALNVGDFRPISLVHSFAKLFSKLIANRLRGKLGELVSTNQSAFVRGRNLHDNFMLVRQVVRKILARRESGVFLKLDISRAFDSLSWAFLFEVLRRMGFGVLFCKWISLLLSTASTQILVNGIPGRQIRYVRGLRQGDPTSPQLFVMVMEVLTMLVVRATEEGLLAPIVRCAPKQRISIYADDVALFLKPHVQDSVTMRGILELFGGSIGAAGKLLEVLRICDSWAGSGFDFGQAFAAV
jgi:hypothetical protein